MTHLVRTPAPIRFLPISIAIEYVCAPRRGKEVRENLPLSPSLLFFEGVVRNRVPSPGRWMSKTSIASSNPQ